MTTTTMLEDRVDSARTASVRTAHDSDIGWAANLVLEPPRGNFAALIRRGATGLGLSAFYGLALGARQGGRALLVHTAGVPLGLALVLLAGVPSLFVFLSMSRAPIDGRTLASAAARGIASAGVVLAGLAPAAVLFVVSSETPLAAKSAVVFGLLLGGGIALMRTTWDVLRAAARGPTQAFGAALAFGFAMFTVAVGIRVFGAVLPILGGGR